MSTGPALTAAFTELEVMKKVEAAQRTGYRHWAASQSLDGAERVRLARLARFQRSSTATRKNNSPGTL